MDTPHKTAGRPSLPDGKKASSQMQFRISQKRKSTYVKAAQKKQMTLAAWSFAQLDAASGYAGE